MMRLAFDHLNLRYNPFGTLEPHEWARAAVLLDGVDTRAVGQPGHAIMFLGEQGRGKSTHMRALWGRAPHAPYLYIAEGEGWRVRLPRGPLLFLDETQRLPRPRRWLLWRRAGVSLVLGTHEDHSAELTRAGYNVQRVHVRGLDVARLDQILRRRVELARRDAAGGLPWVSDEALDRLLGDHGDDLRAITDRLYDVFQRLDAPRAIAAQELG